MRFTKMHGTGNDYVYIDCFKETIQQPEKVVSRISDRHKGIGSDGLVLIMPSDIADFRMRMFNPDGSEAQMCGNASRCVGKYVYDRGLTDKTNISLETKAGIKHLELFPKEGKVQKVRVDMGEPILDPTQIPVAINNTQVINFPLIFDTAQYNITCVSMGNPHTIIFAKQVEGIQIETIGRRIENHPFFPMRTNVEFLEVLSPSLAKMRVWERGTGETQACGTGACAALVAGVLNNEMDRKATIILPGGELEVEWDEATNHVYMTGDAVTVFEGEID